MSAIANRECVAAGVCVIGRDGRGSIIAIDAGVCPAGDRVARRQRRHRQHDKYHYRHKQQR